MFRLDTDALSVTSPTSTLRDSEVEAWRRWAEANESVLSLSVVTLMEVQYGIARTEKKGAAQKAARLRFSIEAVDTLYKSRILPVSITFARQAGRLSHAAQATGVSPSSEEAIIAAAAQVHGFTLLSRNARHMSALSKTWRDPLDVAPKL